MPASWRTSDLTILAGLAIVTVLLTATSFVLSPVRPTQREDGSSYATHDGGGRAAFLLLKDLGYDVERSFDPIGALRAAPATTTLVLVDPTLPASQQDRRALRTFLEQGGTVLVTGANATRFLPEAPRTSPKLTSERRQAAALPGPLTAGVDAIEMPSAVGALPLNDRYVAVYGSYDSPAVLTARFEKGHAIWWATPRPLVNSAIGDPGHAELLVNTLGAPGARRILWDEFYHGYDRSFWSYIAATPLPIAFLQLLVIALAAGFTYSRRQRPIRARVVEPRTSPLEFVDTIGGLYQRAKAANAAVATVYARVRSRLLARAGLPQSATDERLASVAAERLALDSAQLSALLSKARQATTDISLTEAEAVRLAAELQKVAGTSVPATLW
jgi:hypothetical protein